MSDHSSSAENAQDNVGDKKHEKKHSDEPSFNMEELQALAALVNEHGFTDFEFENENIRVRLSKTVPQIVQAALPAPPPAAAPPSHAAAGAPAAPQTDTAADADADADLVKITSPIVGTFYRSPGPDKAPYVSEGSNVSPDTTVCIVEAMKLMNEIQAEVSGEIVKIYVENGEPVEYGQALFGVRK